MNLPNDDNNKIKNIPSIPEISTRMKKETLRNDFQHTFYRENHDEQIFYLFLNIDLIIIQTLDIRTKITFLVSESCAGYG